MTKEVVDRLGQRYGACVVIAGTEERDRGRMVWVLECSCGNQFKTAIKRPSSEMAQFACFDCNPQHRSRSDGKRRTKSFCLALTHDEHELLSRAAKNAGVSKNIVLRRMIIPFLKAVK